MIKANELRLGNYLLDHLGRSLKVSRIGDEYLLVKLSNGVRLKYHINTFKPILLTEETLLKCGFECVHSNNKHYAITDPNGVKDLHKISIFPTINNCWQIAFSDILNGYKDYIPTTKIQYLHELQNLYFALTKTELDVNL